MWFRCHWFYWTVCGVMLSFFNVFTLADRNRSQYATSELNENIESLNGNGKQLWQEELPSYEPILLPLPIHQIAVQEMQSCITAKGDVGQCTSIRQCYPYFKLPQLNNFESWILGMQDTCSYYSSDGRQVIGICCVGLPAPPTEGNKPDSIYENPSSSETPAHYPTHIIPSWPPQIPTHPPNHTIPPLPTHAPSSSYPSFAPTHTHRPSSTHRPPYRPPTSKPTRPPSNHYEACGQKNGNQDQERIVGGHNAEVGEWPWIAALFNGGRQFCGGTLIDRTHILSAAHCVAHMSSWDVAQLTVRLGDYNLKTNSEVRHVEKRVKRVIRHRYFNGRTLYYDISILTLDSPVTFDERVRPICLPELTDVELAGKTATVIGWGSLREGGLQPSILQEVSIPIWSNRRCQIKYGAAAPGGIVEHMLCAGEATRDSCSGDSGGPLMLKINGSWTQIGIVSWGIGCGKGQYPGVYTRVQKLLPWIMKNLK